MNTATCAINGVSIYERFYPLKLMTLRHLWRPCASILLLLSSLFTPLPSKAGNTLNEALIHERSDAVTKMVLGIISYARWPVAPVVTRLCVVAPTNYAEALFNPAFMETAHPIKTQRYSLSDTSIATHCDVVYLGRTEPQLCQELTTRLSGYPILTISEDYDECTFGSAFCLLLEDKQASFKVNMDALARSGIRVHPNVLQLARKKTDAL